MVKKIVDWIKDFWKLLWEEEVDESMTEIEAHSKEVSLKLSEHNFIGSNILKAGLKIWELDTTEKDVTIALREAEVIVTEKEVQLGKLRKKELVKNYHVIVKENCLYTQATNMKTAAKKFIRDGVPKEKQHLYRQKKQ